MPCLLNTEVLPRFGTQCLDFIFPDKFTASELLDLSVQVNDVAHHDTHAYTVTEILLTVRLIKPRLSLALQSSVSLSETKNTLSLLRN